MFFIERFKKDFPGKKYREYVYNKPIHSIYILIAMSSDDIEVLLWCYKNYKSLFKFIILNHSRWWLNLQLFPLKYFDEFLSNPKGWIIEEFIKKCFHEQEIKRLCNISKIQKKLFYEYLLDDIWTFKKGSNYINFIGFCYIKIEQIWLKNIFLNYLNIKTLQNILVKSHV